MVDLKDAIRRAKEYAIQVLELDPAEILLEEVVPSNDHWSITLSFNSRMGPKVVGPLAEYARRASPWPENREFKSFRIKRDTGEVDGMFNASAA
jgi:hypothetical protein